MRMIPHVLSATAEEPFVVQLWNDFIDTFVINDVYYPYLGLEGSDMFQIKLLILGLFIGLAIAAFGGVYDKRVLGNMVRSLLGRGCLSPENAQTLAQLGYARNSIVRHSVRKSVSLRRVVRCVGEEKFLAEQEQKRLAHEEKRKTDKSIGRFREVGYTFDLENDRFYIPEEMKYMADVKFEKKGSTWLGAILFAVIMLVVYVILLINLPGILEILNDFAANFAPTGPKNIV